MFKNFIPSREEKNFRKDNVFLQIRPAYCDGRQEYPGLCQFCKQPARGETVNGVLEHENCRLLRLVRAGIAS